MKHLFLPKLKIIYFDLTTILKLTTLQKKLYVFTDFFNVLKTYFDFQIIFSIFGLLVCI